MRTKIQGAVHSVVGAFSAGVLLLLFAPIDTRAQYNFIPLSFVPAGISGDYIIGGDTLYNFVTQTYTTLDLPGTPTGIDGNNIVGNDGNGAFVYNITSQTYTDYSMPGRVAGISGDNLVGTTSVGNTNGLPITEAAIVYNTATQRYIILQQFENPVYAVPTYGTGIDGDNVIGYFEPDLENFYDTFLYNDGNYSYFEVPYGGPRSSVATGISDNYIVGYYEELAGSLPYVDQGFVYNINSQTYTSLGPGFVLGVSGDDIIGQNSSGYYLGLPVPEPTPFPLLALGFAGLLILRNFYPPRRLIK